MKSNTTAMICACCGKDVRNKDHKQYGSLLICARCGYDFREFAESENCVRSFIGFKKG